MIRRTTYLNTRAQALRKIMFTVAAFATSLAIVACGGYGGTGNTYTPSAAAGTSIVSVGAITGFGSVHLNGLKFETTGATINADGKAAQQSDLHAGEVIEVKGHHDAASGMDIADEIEFRGNVEGPVSAIDIVAQTLVVLGQTVVVSADTSFGDSITPASLAGVAVGDILEVSGMPASDGTLHATRVEKKPASTALQVIGTSASTDSAAKTLKINALVVNFSAATLIDFPSTGPKDGDLVEANGTSLDSAGALQATRLELRTSKEFIADADAQMEIEGLITRFASAMDFDVAGRPVTVSASTTFEGGTASDLALNIQVEAEGSVNGPGVLAATKVQIAHPAEDRITGQVDSVDATAGTAVVMGIQVSVDAMTRFEDHSSQNIETFSLSDVHSGDWLQIRGAPSGSRNSVEATRVDRIQAQSSVLLTGAVAAAAQPNLTILSTTVATTSATQFGNGLNTTTFFTSPVGKVVSVKGTWNGNVLTADQLQVGEDNEH